MSGWSFSASTGVIALIVIVWAASAWVAWANWHRRGGLGPAAMEGLRFVVMTLIAFTLLKPEFVRRQLQTEEPEIVVLSDASRSMETRDVVLDDARVSSREDWWQSANDTNLWRPLQAHGRVVFENFAAAGPATTNSPAESDDGTDIGQALENVLQRPRNLKAILLLSDGDWNAGGSPLSAAIQARSRKVPVYTVGVGSETRLPDLVLQPAAVPSYGLLGEQISLPFKIQSYLPREVKTAVSLIGEGGAQVVKAVTLPPFSQVQDSIIWSPRTLGNYTLTLKLPTQPEEYLQDNNERTFRISIRTEKLRVLVVDSLPRWEYRYLRNALSRDPGVELSCLLWHPGMQPGEGVDYIKSFPGTKEQLAPYDVVFLGDVGIGSGELSSQDAELIKGLVEQQGSGLVFLPGPRGRHLSLLGTPLADLLPIVYDDKKPAGIPGSIESNLILTSSGRDHFLTLLAADENTNESIWRNLPGFYWSAAVLKSRPGSDVLAVHSTVRNAAGRLPLLVTRPYGNGEVLFMGTDSAWRWRRGVEDKYHYRFWGQVVRWMAHKRHMAQGEGLRLAFSPENPRVGESIFLQATILDLASSTEKDRVTARVTSPSGRTERLELAPVTGGWGVYKGSFHPQEGGTYKVSVSTERNALRLETDLVVQKPQREKLGQPANLAVLREISDVTSGQFGTVKDLDALVERISLLPEAEPVEERFRLWANPWWGGFIVLLLAIYWTARKVAGMI